MAIKAFSRYVRASVRAVALAIPLVCAFAMPAQAQIRTDGTLGGPAVSLPGPEFPDQSGVGPIGGQQPVLQLPGVQRGQRRSRPRS